MSSKGTMQYGAIDARNLETGKAQEQGSITSTNDEKPCKGKKKRGPIDPQTTAWLKSQTRMMQCLCYDATGTISVLQALENTDQKGSWYYEMAELAKAILRSRQADAYRLIELGMDALRALLR